MKVRGNIYLIKTFNKKIVPALFIKDMSTYFLFAQLRTAGLEDIFNSKSKEEMIKFNKCKPQRNQIKIREKYEIDTIYIDQPMGLKSKSVVMVKKVHKVDKKQILKKIASISDSYVDKCEDLIQQHKEINNLQKELHQLKQKIQLAQFNESRGRFS